ncbi:MAG: YHS domain-containing protein [Caldilineae bacterium]|nr:MAG: YHS domain-containing protein [Caldilineae bacterium]
MAQAKDPVCGMMVDTETAEHKSEYKGTTYYFCAPGCKRAFDRDPEAYLAEGGESHEGHEHHGHHGHGHH